jgi:HD-GYP domain-containing protein (c-di-GMP phosphodiesterase class II)
MGEQMIKENTVNPAIALQEQICKLEIENEQLKRFIEIEKKIGGERNIDQLLPLIMTEISKFLDADRSTLFLLNWEGMELWAKFAQGLEAGKISIKMKMGIVGVSVLTKQIINVANAYEDPRFNAEIDEITGFKTQSILAAPIMDNGNEVIGAIELLNKKAGLFTKEDEQKVKEHTLNLSETEFINRPDKSQAEAFVSEIRETTQCQRGSLFLINQHQGELFTIASDGLGGQDIRLSINLGIAGLVAMTGKALNIPDAYADSRFDMSTDKITGYRTHCILCVPVKNQNGEALGVIEAINKKNDIFTDADAEYLKALSSGIAIALENAMLFQEQDRQFKSILEVMAASIDAKDPLTAGHSENVTQYAVGIAEELGFGEIEQDILGVAALLHDYGKLGIDDYILKKPGRLTAKEYECIKQHVVITRDILNKMHFSRQYRNVPLIAAYHHERLDGSGYLDGLKSEEIPFMTKIIAVADVFEALTSNRHYRDALPAERAFEILEQDTGTMYDASVVAALKKYWYRPQGQDRIQHSSFAKSKNVERRVWRDGFI